MNNQFTKKIWKAVLTLVFIFSLTACGSAEEESEFQQRKNAEASSKATAMVTFLNQYNSIFDEGTLANYNDTELADVFASLYYNITGDSSFSCEGEAVRTAITSYQSGSEEIGGIMSVGAAASQVDGDTIIVKIPVTGGTGDGELEFVYTNDIYLTMTACALNLKESFGSLMGRAGLNTLLGMGTVFVVLILICAIISCFSLIPKIQGKFRKKPADSDVRKEAADTAAQIPEREEEELADDLELVAVISAAVAAYEGSAGTDGFVVRSIRRAGRR